MEAKQIMRPAGESEKALTRRFQFNREKLSAIKPPAKDRSYVYDTKTPHLVYVVTDKNARSFMWYGRVRGETRPIKARIGDAAEITLEQARETAKLWTADAVKGINPLATKQAAKGEITFGQLFEWYKDNHAKLHKGEGSQKNDQGYYDNHLSTLAGRRAKAVTREELRTIHAKIGKDHPTTANRVLALVSSMYNEARDMMGKHNPAEGITRFEETSRERFLTGDELAVFFAELENEPSEIMRDFFKLAIWTGARRSNVLAMRWDQIDLARRVWTIPAAQAKAGKTIAVPLTDPAMEVLERRKGNGSEWVLNARSKSGHLQEPKKAWGNLLERSKLSDVRIHDLRRTAASWMAAGGTGLPIIGKLLGHQNQSTTAIYARLQLDPVREAMQGAAAAMQAAIDAGKAAKPG